jgi:flagellar FliJ protein
MKLNSLNTMARVRRWELDRLRREMDELQKLQDDLTGRDHKLAQILGREAELAEGGTGDTDYAFFAQRINEQRDSLAESLKEVGRNIDDKQAEVQEVFQELKRFEIVEERVLRRTANELGKREQANLDEVGLLNHLRRNGSGAA